MSSSQKDCFGQLNRFKVERTNAYFLLCFFVFCKSHNSFHSIVPHLNRSVSPLWNDSAGGAMFCEMRSPVPYYWATKIIRFHFQPHSDWEWTACHKCVQSLPECLTQYSECPLKQKSGQILLLHLHPRKTKKTFSFLRVSQSIHVPISQSMGGVTATVIRMRRCWNYYYTHANGIWRPLRAKFDAFDSGAERFRQTVHQEENTSNETSMRLAVSNRPFDHHFGPRISFGYTVYVPIYTVRTLCVVNCTRSYVDFTCTRIPNTNSNNDNDNVVGYVINMLC